MYVQNIHFLNIKIYTFRSWARLP